MKRLSLVLVFLALVGCDRIRPVVTVTCNCCKALLASGVCTMTAAPSDQAVLVPQCKPGEVVVIENWKQMGRGATPLLGCEKEK